MAYNSSIDELNMQTEQDMQKIRAYFEEMELEPEEIEKRISMANDLDVLYVILFLLISATVAIGEDVSKENEYWVSYLTQGYSSVLEKHNYSFRDDYVNGHIDTVVGDILKTTYEHIASDYYRSRERALSIATDEANALCNYEYHLTKIKEGYTRKAWVALRDKKVRHTHVWADGEETDIQKPFIVGGYEMLFPLDQSLGADAREIINCRCTCRYFGKKG